jgi:hypothetical protein
MRGEGIHTDYVLFLYYRVISFSVVCAWIFAVILGWKYPVDLDKIGTAINRSFMHCKLGIGVIPQISEIDWRS